MKVAVIGAGFAGLAVSLACLEGGMAVDLYDREGVGAGASGIASGLLHPYVGEAGKRNKGASVALREARALLASSQRFSGQPVADYQGIVRQVRDELLELFASHEKVHGDLERIDKNLFLVRSGIVVYPEPYLQGLLQACQHLGLQFYRQEVSLFQELQGYDACVFAIGAGVFALPGLESLRLSPVRGQVLLCEWSLPPLARPLVGKGHIVPAGRQRVYLGSTYERVLNESPCLEKALLDLAPKARALVPEWEEITPLQCRAGVRVSCARQYTPLVIEIHKGVFMVTGLGSRGLLYHAHAAKECLALLRARN